MSTCKSNISGSESGQILVMFIMIIQKEINSETYNDIISVAPGPAALRCLVKSTDFFCMSRTC